MLAEHARCRVVRLLDHAADLVVDLACDLLGVVRSGAHVTAEERHVVVAAEHARAELLAHPEPHDHLLGGVGDLLEVVRGAGRDLVEHELLGGAAAERHRHLIHQRALGRQISILARKRDRVPERLAAADDRDLVDVVGALEVVADERVTHLVVRGDLPLLLREQARLLLGAGDHTHDPFLELVLADRLLAAARREQGRLVDHDREEGIMRVIAGPEKKSRLFSEKERKITAYHEMGHALVGYYLEGTDDVHKISIVSRGQALGYTISLPSEDRYLTTKGT